MGSCSSNQQPKHRRLRSQQNENTDKSFQIVSTKKEILLTLGQEETSTQNICFTKEIQTNLHLSLKKGFGKMYTIINECKGSQVNIDQHIIQVQHNLTGVKRSARIYERSCKNNCRIIQLLLQNQLQHPSIINIYDIFEEHKQYIVIQEQLNGDILDQYIKQKGKMQEKELTWFITQILQTIQFLHSHNLAHGRLNNHSFQLIQNRSFPYLKLIDYDQIIYKAPLTLHTATTIAPELIINEESSKEGDVWSCGILSCFILTGELPFSAKNDNRMSTLKHQILRGQIDFSSVDFDKISIKGKQCIQKMFLPPKARSTAQQLLSEEWLQQHIGLNNLKLAVSQLENSKQLTHLEVKLLLLMINNFCVDQKNELFQIFNEIDYNKDGKLNASELLLLFKNILGDSITLKHVQQIIATIDIDLNGTLDFNEFLCAIMNRKSFINQENIKQCFQILDSNKNGKLSIYELSSILNLNQDIVKDDLHKLFSQHNKLYLDFNRFKDILMNIIA